MPPKRKARLPSGGASTPSVDASEQPASEPSTPPKEDNAQSAPVSHEWTDEQETSLLKSVIRWKPVGSSLHAYHIPPENSWLH